jgi:hypothetical protein
MSDSPTTVTDRVADILARYRAPGPRCLPYVVAAWAGWVCPCGHDVADHASSGDGHCTTCRCTKAYLGWQRTSGARPAPTDATITVGGIELIEVQP